MLSIKMTPDIQIDIDMNGTDDGKLEGIGPTQLESDGIYRSIAKIAGQYHLLELRLTAGDYPTLHEMRKPVPTRPAVDEIDIDGYVDQRGIKYFGIAKWQPNGKWHAHAAVGSALCVVEVAITATKDITRETTSTTTPPSPDKTARPSASRKAKR